jgi:hypothetical protein
VPAWRQRLPVGAHPGGSTREEEDAGGARSQPKRRTVGPPTAVLPEPSVAVASRCSQHRFGRNPRPRRNGWSYTHGGPHAKAPSGDVQSRAGPAAHLTRSHRIAIVMPVLLRADHARSAANPASSALARHAAVLEVRTSREVHRRGGMTDDPIEVSSRSTRGAERILRTAPFCLRLRCLLFTSPV